MTPAPEDIRITLIGYLPASRDSSGDLCGSCFDFAKGLTLELLRERLYLHLRSTPDDGRDPWVFLFLYYGQPVWQCGTFDNDGFAGGPVLMNDHVECVTDGDRAAALVAEAAYIEAHVRVQHEYEEKMRKRRAEEAAQQAAWKAQQERTQYENAKRLVEEYERAQQARAAFGK